MERECLPCATVSWKHVSFFLIFVGGSQLSLPSISEEILDLNFSAMLEHLRLGTPGDGLNAFCIEKDMNLWRPQAECYDLEFFLVWGYQELNLGTLSH